MPAPLEPPTPAAASRGRVVVIALAAFALGGIGVATSYFASLEEETDEPTPQVAEAPSAPLPARERCRAGDWRICVRLARGEVSAGGRGIGEEEATELLERACEANYLPACQELGESCGRGIGGACFFLGSRAATHDPEAADELLRRACEADVPEACDEVARP